MHACLRSGIKWQFVKRGLLPRFLNHTYETVINMSADINSLLSEEFLTGLPAIFSKSCFQAGNTAFNPEKGTSNAPCFWGQAEFEAGLKGNKLLLPPPLQQATLCCESVEHAHTNSQKRACKI